jgi:hypothetical protein
MFSCVHCSYPVTKNSNLDNTQHADDLLQRELVDTELEITRLRAPLDQLVRKRGYLKQSLNDRDCPVLRLPPEISGEIFLEYLTSPNPATTKELRTPFQLAHICRTWRDLVWSSPQLCRVVRLDVRFHPHASLLEEWLLRSGQEPLSIHLTWEPSILDADIEKEKQYKLLKELMNVVFRSLARWRVIDFRIPACLYRFKTFRTRDPFPLLTCMSLYDLPPLPGTLSTMFGDAPHLNEIHFTNCRLEHYILPLRQLTRVSLRRSTVEECLAVLSNSPHLTCCTIIDIREQSDNPAVVAVLRLQSLTITSATALPELLDRLTTPFIRELAIASGTSIFPFWNVNCLISRSSCSASLQRLSLAGGCIQGKELFTFLGLTRSLVELRLSSWSLQDEIAQLIGPIYWTSNGFLPRLQILELEGRPVIELSDIKSMVFSRWQQGITGEIARLRQVRLRVISNTPGAPQAVCFQHTQRVADRLYLSVETVPHAVMEDV